MLVYEQKYILAREFTHILPKVDDFLLHPAEIDEDPCPFILGVSTAPNEK